jgi:phosphatidylserine decarboxylase
MKKNSLLYIFMWLLPKNTISRALGWLVACQLPGPIARLLNHAFVKIFKINIEEADQALSEFKTIQEIFVRRLKPDLRPICLGAQSVASPCDGTIGECGEIRSQTLLQIKGKSYSLTGLLRSEELVNQYDGGYFLTIYLSPKDYHRFHAPIDGQLTESYYVPGNLWPVNKWGLKSVDDLFCVNERIISIFKNASAHSMAHIAVGATLVGKVHLSYSELETNVAGKTKAVYEKNQTVLNFSRGQELGYFSFGSTIVLLFEAGMLEAVHVRFAAKVIMGQKIATMKMPR